MDLKIFNDNHDTVIAISICIAISFFVYGCESSVESILNPTVKITRDQLDAEVKTFLATAEANYAALDRQDDLKQMIFEKAALFTQEGSVNPYGILTNFLSVVAVGFGLDQRRKKNSVQESLALVTKTNAENKTTTGTGAPV